MTESDGSQNGHSPLTREQIIAAVDRKIEWVDVPEWSGGVYIRNLTGRARDRFDRSRYRVVGKGTQRDVEILYEDTRATLLAESLCDKDGTLIFAPGDIEALSLKNGAVLDRLFAIAQRLSGLRPEDIEARAKNS